MYNINTVYNNKEFPMKRVSNFLMRLFAVIIVFVFLFSACEGPMGPQGIQGEKGDPGTPGQHGSVLTIGADGYWYIDNVNTGIKALGSQGDPGSVVTIVGGYWYIDGENTHVKAVGIDGRDSDISNTITIVGGYWYIDGENTHVKALGENGIDGTPGSIVTIFEGYWYIDGVNTNVKAYGTDGLSIIWKGEFVSPPADAEKNWVYFNTALGNAYVYDGANWQLLVRSGTDGSHGVSIVWHGTRSSAPVTPLLNWAYYNNVDKKSYIWDGEAWQVLAQDGEIGPEGPKGDKGDQGDPGIDTNPFVPVTGVSLPQAVTVTIGYGKILTAEITPENASVKGLIWNSDNIDIAIVTLDGMIRPISPGTAVITVITADGLMMAECIVTVVLPVWTAVADSTFGTNAVNGITWGGPAGQEKFVAVGSNGRMAYSSNGVTWTAVANTTFDSSSIHGITWGGPTGQEKFVAVGGNGRIAYSSNGVTWTAVTTSTFLNNTIWSVSWSGPPGEERFFATGAIFNGGGLAVSNDGIAWTTLTSTAFGTDTVFGITWGGQSGQEQYVTCIGVRSTAPTNRILYSSNGTTWTSVGSLAASAGFYGISYGGISGQKFVVVGGATGTSPNSRIAYSFNGINWTTITSTPFGTAVINNVRWCGPARQEIFIIVGNAGRVGYSADGQTWNGGIESAFNANNIQAAAWGGQAGQERFVAVGVNGTIAYTTER